METERLVLQRFTFDDGHYLYDLDNDPEVMRYINGGVPTSKSVIEKDILPVFLAHEKSEFGFWKTIEKGSSKFVGWVSLRPLDDKPDEARIGYRFRRENWGKGYATEAMRALVDTGFENLGLARILATTYEDNLASRRVMEKLGLTWVRSFHIDQLDSETTDFSTTEIWDGDDVEYALRKAEWQAHR